MDIFSARLPGTTIKKIRDYAKKHGMKIWCVIVAAIDKLTEK